LLGTLNTATARTATIHHCHHQCTKCGVLYECENNLCRMPFSYGKCPRCNFV